MLNPSGSAELAEGKDLQAGRWCGTFGVGYSVKTLLIGINDQPVVQIGVKPDGHISLMVDYDDGPIDFYATGFEDSCGETCISRWRIPELHPGDALTILLGESDRRDPPSKTRTGEGPWVESSVVESPEPTHQASERRVDFVPTQTLENVTNRVMIVQVNGTTIRQPGVTPGIMLTLSFDWNSDHAPYLRIMGYDGHADEFHRWRAIDLQVGDEVVVHLITDITFDLPFQKITVGQLNNKGWSADDDNPRY